MFEQESTADMALRSVSQRQQTPSAASPCAQESRISFLDLPCEVRLQIYHLVHLSSPVQQPQLAPWYPNPSLTTHGAHLIVLDDEAHEDASRRGLSHQRPFCRIPTALLQTCQQVHAEACTIPFHTNGFAFDSLFSSGLASALAFTRGRRPWQRDSMRFVRLEVSAREVLMKTARAGTRFADWVQVCEYWSCGLRELRLVVRTEGEGATYEARGAGQGRVGEEVDEDEKLGDAWALVDGETEWIRQGLGRLAALRRLEVELADVRWTRGDKVRWRGRLRASLLSCTARGRTDVEVVCVERRGERRWECMW